MNINIQKRFQSATFFRIIKIVLSFIKKVKISFFQLKKKNKIQEAIDHVVNQNCIDNILLILD